MKILTTIILISLALFSCDTKNNPQKLAGVESIEEIEENESLKPNAKEPEENSFDEHCDENSMNQAKAFRERIFENSNDLETFDKDTFNPAQIRAVSFSSSNGYTSIGEHLDFEGSEKLISTWQDYNAYCGGKYFGISYVVEAKVDELTKIRDKLSKLRVLTFDEIDLPLCGSEGNPFQIDRITVYDLELNSALFRDYREATCKDSDHEEESDINTHVGYIQAP